MRQVSHTTCTSIPNLPSTYLPPITPLLAYPFLAQPPSMRFTESVLEAYLYLWCEGQFLEVLLPSPLPHQPSPSFHHQSLHLHIVQTIRATCSQIPTPAIVPHISPLSLSAPPPPPPPPPNHTYVPTFLSNIWFSHCSLLFYLLSIFLK